MRWALVWLALLFVGGCQSAPPPAAVSLPKVVCGANLRAVGDRRHGYGTPAARQTLERLRKLGVNTIGVVLEAHQSTERASSISLPSRRDRQAVEAMLSDANALGFATVLVPHLVLQKGRRGDIQPEHPDQWWEDYNAYLDEATRMASRTGTSVLSLGVELKSLSWQPATRQRMVALAQRVRQSYPGLLTYSANWDEAPSVAFWDALDLAGVNAYYPLVPDVELGAERAAQRLEGLAAQAGRDVLVLEVGYKSSPRPHLQPWQWPEEVSGAVDFEAQAACWTAVLKHWLTARGVRGLLLWVIPTDPATPTSEPRNGFSPLGKPAEAVIRAAFTSTGPPAVARWHPAEPTGRPQLAIIFGYYFALAALVLLSLQRAWLALPGPRNAGDSPLPDELPVVTVQLPIYNEAAVVERLIGAAAALDWPAEKLEIQVLDDSDDETADLVAAALGRHGGQHLRGDRSGYKAGALQRGLEVSRGDFLAVFDADFIPPADFLKRTVPHFQDPQVGLVQVRWDHLNSRETLLTRLQALMLDGHFCLEQAGRHARGAFFNFNGTAGVWRKEAILDSGGWSAETLTEDLHLSYRAQLRGWKFVYRNDLVAPAELPADMASFRGQQHRWAKGSAQTALRVLPEVWRQPLPWRVKLEATFHLAANLAHPLMVVLALLMPWVPLASRDLGWPSPVWVDGLAWFAGLGALAVFYGVAVRRARRRVLPALGLLPGLVAVGAGLSVYNSGGLLAALLHRRSPFVRTPKRGGRARARYRATLGTLPLAELALVGWLLYGVTALAEEGLFLEAAMPSLFAWGLLWVSAASILQSGARKAAREESRS